MRKAIVLLIFSLMITGCVEMRDYTGVKHGAFALCKEQGFGEGKDTKDYYVIDDQLALIVRDTKNEVTRKIGSPDTIERTIDGFDCWSYSERKLKLYFEGDHLKLWNEQ
ncbi:MAG: hypothetical protein GY858_06325 [Candidatus Omnitrophica bacterium]|nr:hypothetical protein [Candidatus Omnitrophota bacterium]